MCILCLFLQHAVIPFVVYLFFNPNSNRSNKLIYNSFKVSSFIGIDKNTYILSIDILHKYMSL